MKISKIIHYNISNARFYLFSSTTIFIYYNLLFNCMKVIIIKDRNDAPPERKTVVNDVIHYNDRVNSFLNIAFARKRSRRE